MSWKMVKLDDCLELITYGFTNPMPDSEHGPWKVTAKDIANGRIDFSTARHTTEEAFTNDLTDKSRPIKDDILLTKDGTLGRLAIVGEEQICINQSVALLRLKKHLLLPRYLLYLLQTPEYQGKMMADAGGSTIKHIYITKVNQLLIPVPPLDKQQQIIDVLFAYDSMIDNCNAQINLLEEAAQRLYKEWFVDLRFPGHENTPIVDGVPEGWQKCTLNEICTVKKDTVTSKQIAPDTPYIGLEHMPRIDFCLSDWGKAEDVTSNKFRYSEDDIIFGKIRPYFHKVGFALNCGVVSTDSFVMVAKSGLWGLLLMTVFDKAFVEYTYQTCKEGSKMPRADWKQMEKYPVLIPNQDILNQFEQYVWTITRKIKMLALQNRALSEARDRLLPKLMNGEIEV